jgi:hypothetical protein
METATWNSDINIDTSILLMRFCGEYFGGKFSEAEDLRWRELA